MARALLGGFLLHLCAVCLAASTARHRRIMQSSLRTLAAGRRVGRALASAPLAGAVIAPVVARRGPSALIALRACSSQSAASAHPQVIEVEPPADAAASDEKPEAHRPPRAARPTPPPWQLSAVLCHRPVRTGMAPRGCTARLRPRRRLRTADRRRRRRTGRSVRARSSPISTATLWARMTPSAPSPWRFGTGGGGSGSTRRCGRRSCRRTS